MIKKKKFNVLKVYVRLHYICQPITQCYIQRTGRISISAINVACQFNPVSRSDPVVSGLPPSTDGGCFGRCAGFHGFSY